MFDKVNAVFRVAVKVLSFCGVIVIAVLPATTFGQQSFPPFVPKGVEQFFGGSAQESREKIDAIEISPREELKLGESASREYLAGLRKRGIRIVKKGEDVKYLRSLVSLVHPKMQNAVRYKVIRVYVVDSSETDARSFPGGTLIFFRGLLDFAQNEAALVGVIGHELSHLDHGHQLYDARRMKLMRSQFEGGRGFSSPESLRESFSLFGSFSKPFRPEDEAEADKDGATWAYELGYDPRQMAELFLRMHKRDPALTRGMPTFLRSHPYHIDRYEAVTDCFNKLLDEMPKDKLYIGRENLLKRVPRSAKTF